MFDNALGIHPYSMQLRLERAEIIASNLANVDTPGFKARDIDYRDIMQQVDHKMATKQDSPYSSSEVASQLQYRVPFQPSLDGNTSELNVEQAKFAANSMDFETSLTFLYMKLSGLHQAIKGE